MAHPLDALLDEYRAAATSERDKGTRFEQLCMAYLLHDPIQANEFEQAWTWADWARERGSDARDIGIDLVAKPRGEDGFVAIQAKFRAPGARIRKEEIDSFISASGKTPFVRRLVIDTTLGEWSGNAEEMLRDQAIPVRRIGLKQMRESPIDWSSFRPGGAVGRRAPKDPLPHQDAAIKDVAAGLDGADRGKLVMACGTGKTFTALRVAEQVAGAGRRVLYMVPSLALMSQTIREWSNDATIGLRSFSVCSDVQVGAARGKAREDAAEIEIHDLDMPATTDPAKLAREAGRDDPGRMSVVFATYQSVQVIAKAHAHGLPGFDLAICDEAHRTTGDWLKDEDQSSFTRVHDDRHVRARKRLYMTATPRVYGNRAKEKADAYSITLASMDDAEIFGKPLHVLGFGTAVKQKLLSDYKVIVLAVDEGLVGAHVQGLLDEDSELNLDDATKIVGCYKALAKRGIKEDLAGDSQPMRRALAFCNSIRSSKLMKEKFAAVVSEYRDKVQARIGRDEDARDENRLSIATGHVDGAFNAKRRGQLLDWLDGKDGVDPGKDVLDDGDVIDGGGGTCRILSNARCLSEGVDVPGLDAILFLHPRKSHVDVVQSVGRVMRKAPGKKMGYVILPVAIPAGVAPEIALRDNSRFGAIWQILNALRSHDERLEGEINAANLGDMPERIKIVGVNWDSEELRTMTAEVEDLSSRGKRDGVLDPRGGGDGREPRDDNRPEQGELALDDTLSRAIMAQVVKKCGTDPGWKKWAADIAGIARRHVTRIEGILDGPDARARDAFDGFLSELRESLNEGISRADAIEMLAQHLITRPVFEALFQGHSFVDQNPVSRAMSQVIAILDEKRVDKEARDLDAFYESVKARSQAINSPGARQRLIVELYDQFFKSAFPRVTEKLGIVYTPVEIVDFIIHGVNDILRQEFGQTLGSRGVHIIDPFTGTGTFITRLLQSGLIAPDEMKHKFRHEIHANEIVLLAYYIAAINIEMAYQAASGGEHVPFEGICLTDTFEMREKDLDATWMDANNQRRKKQDELDIRVIIGNPPYSVGQKRQDDNTKNTPYPALDKSIRESYAERSQANSKRNLYDSYIRAIKWASDRLGEDGGVVGFVAGSGWIDKPFADGMRRCLEEECSSIHVLNLRGDARKDMLSGGVAREGGNVFGQGSMSGIAIVFLAKNKQACKTGQVHYHDIGDGLATQEKLAILRENKGLARMTLAHGSFVLTQADENGDWINQRDISFGRHLAIGDKDKGATDKLFENFTLGVATGRDTWCYNSSKPALEGNIRIMVDEYNRVLGERAGVDDIEMLDGMNNPDLKKISWTVNLKHDLKHGKDLDASDGEYRISTYRPFCKQWLFYSSRLNERRYQTHKMFPVHHSRNKMISVSGIGARTGFGCLMCDEMPSLHTIDSAQHFPLKTYEEVKQSDQDALFEGAWSSPGYQERDGITDHGLRHFQSAYGSAPITKEDVFYYVYGLLHSEDYRARFALNLGKELPRIPAVKRLDDFYAFVRAGRDLGELHLGYESVEPYQVDFAEGNHALINEVRDNPEAFYSVEKMRLGGPDGKDRSIIRYNPRVTLTGIPERAWDYVVNGKPALKWVMDRQCIRSDKKSGIVNDANRFAVETMGDPRYPLDLVRRVITVSLRTLDIVAGLPQLDID